MTGTFSSNLLGLFLAAALNLLSYWMVISHALQPMSLTLSIGGLAALQALLLLRLFFNPLHESKPRWNLMVFLFMVLVLLIIVVGSIWIMYNLSYDLMAK